MCSSTADTTPGPATTPAATTPAVVTTPLADNCEDILALVTMKDTWNCRACSRARIYGNINQVRKTSGTTSGQLPFNFRSTSGQLPVKFRYKF